jgi:hypothetical protein
MVWLTAATESGRIIAEAEKRNPSEKWLCSILLYFGVPSFICKTWQRCTADLESVMKYATGLGF